MDVDEIPIFYSFRRCPYAIRARLALAVAGLRPGIDLELREVNLRARPPELYQVCPRATVPVLVLPAVPGGRASAAHPAGQDDPTVPGAAGAAAVQAWPAGGPGAGPPIVAAPRVIDQSLAIMLWALSRRDPQAWLLPSPRLAPAVAAAERALIQRLIAQNDGPFKHHLDRFRYPERFLSEQHNTDPEDAAAGLPPPLSSNDCSDASGDESSSAGSASAARPGGPGPAGREAPLRGGEGAGGRAGQLVTQDQPVGTPSFPSAAAAAPDPAAAAARITARRLEHRRAALAILQEWNARLRNSPWLVGSQPCLADIALLPFVRQFQLADPPGFAAEAELQPLRHWLARLLAWPLLAEVMEAPWGPRSSWHSPRWLYHLALVEEWRAARAAGIYRRSSRGLALEQVGFVHACQAHQLAATHQRFYADLPAASVRLLSIDPDRLAQHGVPVRFEPAPDTGELFPHLYGALPVQAVLLAEPYRPPDTVAARARQIGGGTTAGSPRSGSGQGEAGWRQPDPQQRP